MKKGQSLVIQYVLFFIIGLSVFLGIGSFFKFQSDIFRTEIIDAGLKITNSQITGLMSVAHESCKLCDYVQLTFKPRNSTASYQYIVITNSSGIYIISGLSPYFYSSSSHNLNYSLSFVPSKVISTRPLTLTFNKNQNTIGVK